MSGKEECIERKNKTIDRLKELKKNCHENAGCNKVYNDAINMAESNKKDCDFE